MSELLLNLLKERIRQGGDVSVELSGHSMYPTIRDGEKITIEYYDFEEVQVNDIIACYFKNIKHFVIHRVVNIDFIHGKRVLMTKGDNNDYVDAHAVKSHNFVGMVKVWRTEKMSEDIYYLAPNVVYIKDRKCVLKCDAAISSIPVDILPDKINECHKKANRTLTTELIILLSYKCNLDCIYCSNNSGKDDKLDITVKAENIIKAITFVIKNALLSRKIKPHSFVKPARIFVSGGGEPTVEWNLLTVIVDTVSSLKKEYGNDIAELSILTNAQMCEDKADYLINNFDKIAISCDGFSIQDKQRPRKDLKSSKEQIKMFLNKLDKYNKEVSIRMTVTGEALPYLQDDVDYFFGSFSVIRDIIIEPCVHVGRGKDANVKKLDYNDFVAKFDVVVRKYYKNVYNSASLLEFTNGYPCQRLFGISLVLSPYNVITCCDTVTPESSFWESMIVSSLEDEKIKITNDYIYSAPESCKACIAFEFCAGGCPIHLSDLNDNEKEEFCKYRRDMLKTELLRRVDLSEKVESIEYDKKNYTVYSLPRKEL